MKNQKLEKLVLNMVNFHFLFEKEFVQLLPVLQESEITPLLSRVLNEVHLKGKTTSSELSKTLNLSIPNTSRSVNMLYQMGMIEKKQNQKDKRVSEITLSIKGLELIKRYIGISQDKFFEKCQVYSEVEVDQLNEAFDLMKNAFIKLRENN